MAADSSENHQACTTKFIELANKLTEEGMSKELVSAALMSASCIYATFSVAGNDGGLNNSGVKKVVATYENNLRDLQALKKKQAGKA
jgi:uncharacterized protein (UPF0333 family)